MKIATFLGVGAAALVITQCSLVHNGIVPVEPVRPLSSEAFSFALMGDIPYSERQVELFEKLIVEVNADPAIELVLHAGDIKGSGSCHDQLYWHRFELFNQFQKPFVYSIGDNEWTDCHKEENGQYNPQERLDFLRTLFFANPLKSSGSHPIPMRSQSTNPVFQVYVEHRMFQHRGVVFGTVHVVGSNNGLAPWSGIDPEDSFLNPRSDRMEEFLMRQKAASHWLKEVFQFAQEAESPGIVILIQANPRFELVPDDEERAGFNGFIDTLRDLTVEYGKPVLLAHGHIHFLLVDKPLDHSATEGPLNRIPNLIRIQTPGSPFVRWIKMTVDPQSLEVFHFVEPYLHKLDSIPW